MRVPALIISCPSCGTRYDVPDSAIGPAGRKLKCAACGHGWHVDAARPDQAALADDPVAPPPPVAAPAPPAPPVQESGSREDAPPPRPAAAPAASPPPIPAAPPVPAPTPEPAAATAPPPAAGPSPFDYQPPFEPQPRGTRWLLWLVLALVVVAIAAFVAVRTDAGGVAGRVGLAQRASPVVISFTTRPERRPMDSGNELLAVAGKVTNPTETPVRVPDIRAELRDSQGRAVYNWTIGAPVTRLAPGASAEFNAAEVDVPPAARTIHLKPGPMPQV